MSLMLGMFVEISGICVHENPDKTVEQLLKDTDTILKNINVYKDVVKKNKMLRKELKWIIEDVCISKKYKDCSEMKSKRRESGIYTIYPDKSKGIKVYCDMTDGKGWTVIQRRIDGSTDFARTWNEYKEGFGDVRKEYWFGNKYLNILTSSGDYLSCNNGKYFSTKDKDNDSNGGNCATLPIWALVEWQLQ
ncbi:unnamed protein product [Mytilus edulis]|uniref:Fibrinogen C-terminal domain-containing protein n=1 Tax=Mytilus edulis TaxID=6550 RepID=A0A8S3S5A2_MYTED|nr:unnamed protein product [Mytilus edulis]